MMKTRIYYLMGFLLLIGLSLSAQKLSYESQEVLNPRAQAAAHTKAMLEATLPQRLTADYVPGFNVALFQERLQANGCLETNQEDISVSTVNEMSQVGTFSNGIDGAGLSIDAGIVLTTADLDVSFISNNMADATVEHGADQSDAVVDSDFDNLNDVSSNQGTFDEAILIFDFTIPEGLNGLRVPFQFASEEYPEYTQSTLVLCLMMFLPFLFQALGSTEQ